MSKMRDVVGGRAVIFKLSKDSEFDEGLKKRSEELFNLVERAIFKALDKFGEKAVAIIQEQIEASSPSGRIYEYVEKDGVTQFIPPHTASAPGQPPAILSGDLVHAIEYHVHTSDQSVEVGVPPGVEGSYPTLAYRNGKVIVGGNNRKKISEYLIYLEWGTSRMRPRPFFKKGFGEAKKMFNNEMKNALREEVTRKMGRKKLIPVYFRIKVTK